MKLSVIVNFFINYFMKRRESNKICKINRFAGRRFDGKLLSMMSKSEED